MALKKCDVCGNAISTKAYGCPHCGHPDRMRWDMVGALFIVILIYGMLVVVVALPVSMHRAARKADELHERIQRELHESR
jgi:predicted nucleic acid-binding Zn ribbon protein